MAVLAQTFCQLGSNLCRCSAFRRSKSPALRPGEANKNRFG